MSEKSIFRNKLEEQKAREESFWCDEMFNIWYKNRILGPVFNEKEWDQKDLKFYHTNCAGK
jgi:hypothetical protein